MPIRICSKMENEITTTTENELTTSSANLEKDT